MSYNFKTIKVIPPASELINIILSKTQRKTPTVVHPGYAISRIRSFYMRKIKFCQESLNEKLLNILENFPKVEDIHPFYGDLFNVLYDKDHYKLALGHVKATKSMVENMTKDYLKLVKYADSLYRCKSLKRAALGRVCTMIRKINSSLAFLEEVRKHLGRLPNINPYERTILLTGYPNVGKSSFVNSVSKANVEVQPYPFTTQALYVGHTDYKNLRYQVIDSPGILDHQLDEMNTIEMQSITALAHLKSCVIYFVDPSEQCGYSVLEQIHLYHTIKPLFKNKPVVVAFNKTDLKKVEELPNNKKEAIKTWLHENNLKSIEMSTLNS
jgi:nucleolar GTP-binding protein